MAQNEAPEHHVVSSGAAIGSIQQRFHQPFTVYYWAAIAQLLWY